MYVRARRGIPPRTRSWGCHVRAFIHDRSPPRRLGRPGRRLGGWAGLVAAVLFLVGTFIPGAPPDGWDAPADDIAKFMVDSRSGGLWALVAIALALPLFLVFAGAVRDRIAAQVEPGLARAGALSGALSMVFVLIATITIFGVSWIDGRVEQMSSDVAQVAWNLASVYFFSVNPLAALFVAVVGLAGLRGALGKWHAWVSLVVAAVTLIGVFGLVNSGLADIAFLGLLLVYVWILVTSIVMIREG